MMYMFRFEWKTNRQGGTTSSLHQLSVFFSMQMSHLLSKETYYLCLPVGGRLLPEGPIHYSPPHRMAKHQLVA